MDWLSIFHSVVASAGAIGTAVVGVITAGHSQKLKNLVDQITPIATAAQTTINAALPVAG